jgi:hypothetical protein
MKNMLIASLVASLLLLSVGAIADCGNNFGKCNDECKPGDNCDGSLWYQDKWQDTMWAAWTGSNNDDNKCDGNKCDGNKCDDFMWFDSKWDDFKWDDFKWCDFKFDDNKFDDKKGDDNKC